MNSADWIRAGVTVLAGALAGGLTNTVAVWMLFHPHKPPRLLGWTLTRFQGAIPANQDRLAAAVGRAVGEELLAPGDLGALLQGESENGALEARVRDSLRSLLDRMAPLGSEVLDAHIRAPELVAQMEPLLLELLPRVREELRGLTQDPAFREGLSEAVEGMLESGLAALPLPKRMAARLFLTAETREALVEALEARAIPRILSALESPLLRRRLAALIQDGLVEFGRGEGGWEAPVRAALSRIPSETLALEARQWLQEELVQLTSGLDVSGQVEAKVRAFPSTEMERLVRQVTERELRLIIRLGYGLGALIGGILVGVHHLMP
jgi:uncharacterized membrane protein YheB (UPF0754 family)